MTQRLLIRAGEELFSERGISAVSAREITLAAGVRNSTALQYHFGNRDGLLQAVLRKHHRGIEVSRHELLDAYERDHGAGAGPDADLRELVAAYVRPAAAKLADPDGGRAYLRIVAQLVNRPDIDWLDPARASARDSTARWRTLVAPQLPEVAVRRLHRRFTAIRVTFIELARRAEMAPARSDRLFTSHLIDLVTALLQAPLSSETAQLVEESSRRRAR
jgi:AcrR family transcriptional regulator